MTLLLTGASGFVGSAIYRTAQERGLPVRPVFRSQASAVGCGVPLAAAAIQPSLDASADWKDALKGIDVVIHAAARVHVMKDKSADPLAEFRKVNVDGTLNLARQAAAAGVRRFVFISSIGVNGGETFTKPFTAADKPAPEEPYAVSKFEAEEGLLALAEKTAMAVTIIRPPLVYGPGAPGNFGRLVTAIRKRIWLPLGAVHNRRTLVAVDNLADLILLCTRHPAAANQILLAGDAEDLSTTDLLCRLGIAMGRPARLLPVPIKLMEATAGLIGRQSTIRKICGNLQVDITKTRELLDWTPPVSVDEELQQVAKHP